MDVELIAKQSRLSGWACDKCGERTSPMCNAVLRVMASPGENFKIEILHEACALASGQFDQNMRAIPEKVAERISLIELIPDIKVDLRALAVAYHAISCVPWFHAMLRLEMPGFEESLEKLQVALSDALEANPTMPLGDLFARPEETLKAWASPDPR